MPGSFPARNRANQTRRPRRPIPARLLLDTGASGLCLILTTPYAERHGLGSVAPAIEAPIGTGLVGDLHGTIVRLQELRLGRVKVRSPTTGLGGEYKGFLARTDIDGVIGNSVFEGSRLIVDYVGRRAIVEPGPSDGSLCDFDMSGLRLAARGPGLAHIVVDYVIPGSPSAEAGIAVGDELLLIDGRGGAQGNLSDACDRKSTRLNSSNSQISYAVFCLEKKGMLARLADGDRAAFPPAFTLLWPVTRAFARSYLRDVARAEDAAPQALIRALLRATEHDV